MSALDDVLKEIDGPEKPEEGAPEQKPPEEKPAEQKPEQPPAEPEPKKMHKYSPEFEEYAKKS